MLDLILGRRRQVQIMKYIISFDESRKNRAEIKKSSVYEIHSKILTHITSGYPLKNSSYIYINSLSTETVILQESKAQS